MDQQLPAAAELDWQAIAERIVFIGGLHRSGTTPVARWLTAHPDVSGLRDTGVPEDEGQHLQSIYPPARDHGGPGLFAFQPTARLTEDSPLVQPGVAEELIAAWAPYWDVSKPVLIEKSPPNLIRMRFLRALFPRAKFIVVMRHPLAVAVATSKWTPTSMDSLLHHWVVAHRHLLHDAERAGSVALVRYEDLMAHPQDQMDRLFAFLALTPHRQDWPVRERLNEAYFERFTASRWPWRRRQFASLVERHEEAVAPYGYSISAPTELRSPAPEVQTLLLPAPHGPAVDA